MLIFFELQFYCGIFITVCSDYHLYINYNEGVQISNAFIETFDFIELTQGLEVAILFQSAISSQTYSFVYSFCALVD